MALMSEFSNQREDYDPFETNGLLALTFGSAKEWASDESDD